MKPTPVVVLVFLKKNQERGVGKGIPGVGSWQKGSVIPPDPTLVPDELCRLKTELTELIKPLLLPQRQICNPTKKNLDTGLELLPPPPKKSWKVLLGAGWETSFQHRRWEKRQSSGAPHTFNTRAAPSPEPEAGGGDSLFPSLPGGGAEGKRVRPSPCLRSAPHSLSPPQASRRCWQLQPTSGFAVAILNFRSGPAQRGGAAQPAIPASPRKAAGPL